MDDRLPQTIRSLSCNILRDVEEGCFLDEAIDDCFSRSDLSDKEKGLIYRITSGVTRSKGYLDWVLASFARKEIKKDLRFLLLIGLYQIAFMKKATYHIVNETVDHAKRIKGKETANFVNAVLRRYIRERLNRPEEVREIVLRSYPSWLVKRWQKRFGEEEAFSLMSSLMEMPRFGIRVDTNRINLPDAVVKLAAEGVETAPGRFSHTALLTDRLAPLLKGELFAHKLVAVQDEMSQLVGMAVAGAHKENGPILDACAGLGTKSLQIAQLCPSAIVISMDNSMTRLRYAQAGGPVIIGDALEAPFRKESFPTILVDAPCSSLGILRKHPEIKWRRNLKDILAFGKIQLDLLRALWHLLIPGGTMVYSVCSFEPEETTHVIENFRLEKRFTLENPLPFLFNKEYFLVLPHETGTDGFFIAEMKKI